MDEKRKFFRIKNTGDIFAKTNNFSLSVIDISAASIAIKPIENLASEGVIEIIINNFSLKVNYQTLRTTQDSSVLIFNNEDQVYQLLPVLKNLRQERNRLSPDANF